jgi:CheY-like chemotaxis protein
MTVFCVLHVDDDPVVREVVEDSLRLSSVFVVQSCASSHEALSIVAQWLPDIILLDVVMPVMDGPQTLARLRAFPPTAYIPVVFMTARAQNWEVELFRSCGAAGVVRKPFNPLTLAGSLINYLQPIDERIHSPLNGFMQRVMNRAAMLESRRFALKGRFGGCVR